MKPFDYRCKFCGKPGVVYGDEEGLEFINPAKWLPNICCTRCGKYMDEKRKVVDGLSKACRTLEMVKLMSAPKQMEAITRGKSALDRLTRMLAEVVCNHYKVQTVWSDELPQMILDKPDSLHRVIALYIQGIIKITKNQQAAMI